MRIQFEFSDEAVKELDTLKSKLNVRYRGEVLNHAIGVLKWLVNERKRDSQIVVKRPDGTMVEVVFPQVESLLSSEEEVTHAGR